MKIENKNSTYFTKYRDITNVNLKLVNVKNLHKTLWNYIELIWTDYIN